ncbi:MAG: CDP-alcohol phosphatidyltransferase family protein [Bacteroidota bacterium]
MKFIPNLLTLLNLLCGCLAIVFLLTDGMVLMPADDGTMYFDLPASIGMASVFIGVAAVLDYFDGFLARLLKVESAMGIQLDSLADVVTFGVAPGMILFSFLRLSWASESTALDTSVIYLVPAFLVPMAAAWRLARFNISPSNPHHFTGVPSPAVGLTVAMFPLAYWMPGGSWMTSLLQESWFLYLIIGLLSVLMIVRLPMMSMKLKSLAWSQSMPQYIFLLISLGLAIWLRWTAALPVFAVYVLLSLLFQKQIR